MSYKTYVPGVQKFRSYEEQTRAWVRGTFCSEELANAEQKGSDFMIFLFFHDTNHVVNGESSVLMLEVQGLHIECPVQRPAVLNPVQNILLISQTSN